MILLDTHIWIWFNTKPELVPQPILERLMAPNADARISAVSIWEFALAVEKGRIAVRHSPEKILNRWLRDDPVQVVPLDKDVALLSRSLEFEHDDPADRFIAATAHMLKCPLATVDTKLLRLPWLATL